MLTSLLWRINDKKVLITSIWHSELYLYTHLLCGFLLSSLELALPTSSTTELSSFEQSYTKRQVINARIKSSIPPYTYIHNIILTSFHVVGASYSEEMDDRLDNGVGNLGRVGIGGGLGGGDNWGSDLHDEEDDDDTGDCWCLS